MPIRKTIWESATNKINPTSEKKTQSNSIKTMKVNHVISFLNQIAPPAYQESYDNSGLIIGDGNAELTGILVSLDCTEAVIEEAIEKGFNLVVAHHPIVFGGLRKITGKNYVERTVIKAIKNNISIFAIHTNLDNVKYGVNAKISEKIGLHNTKILSPKSQILKKLTVFTPTEGKEKLLGALSKAGAGNIGDYSKCSFQTEGVGTFKPDESANPHIGEYGKLEMVPESRIEVIFPAYLEGRILSAMREAHLYEEVAHYIHLLENDNQDVGSGMIGELAKPMEAKKFLAHLKKAMNLKVIKHTHLLDKPIKTVAVCGGSGGFLLRKAISKKADIFITADYKYHEFFDADGQIVIADIGHYESEIFTKDLLKDFLVKEFGEVKIETCEVITNPVEYFK
ncbi:MAG: dinuclear metal center YbgI/SA1388 family protein [Arenicella sp.]|jgi:dinuclear metal center YbgI/SA1388 family protein